ncbi:hypothetical protein COL10_17930 [Bacillus cereus]|nr:hypothetical protein CN468_08485 [Bacillus cereus]PFB71071.1 hypothetical protein CN291_00550 [Bacillus cereus]PFV08945.1 hypothetical protein COL10_17930 [Bacillus cereus]PGV43334.1 hypothetical protein COD74_18495 [Bacillus cereus]
MLVRKNRLFKGGPFFYLEILKKLRFLGSNERNKCIKKYKTKHIYNRNSPNFSLGIRVVFMMGPPFTFRNGYFQMITINEIMLCYNFHNI